MIAQLSQTQESVYNLPSSPPLSLHLSFNLHTGNWGDAHFSGDKEIRKKLKQKVCSGSHEHQQSDNCFYKLTAKKKDFRIYVYLELTGNRDFNYKVWRRKHQIGASDMTEYIYDVNIHGDNLEMSASAQISQAHEELVTQPKSLLEDYADAKFLWVEKQWSLVLNCWYFNGRWALSPPPSFCVQTEEKSGAADATPHHNVNFDSLITKVSLWAGSGHPAWGCTG